MAYIFLEESEESLLGPKRLEICPVKRDHISKGNGPSFKGTSTWRIIPFRIRG